MKRLLVNALIAFSTAGLLSACSSVQHERDVFPDGMPLVAMYPSFTLFKINRIGRQVPVNDGVTISMEIQPLLTDRGGRQDEWPEG